MRTRKMLVWLAALLVVPGGLAATEPGRHGESEWRDCGQFPAG